MTFPTPPSTRCARKLDAAGIRVNCFGSTIANWSKSVDEPFAETLATVERTIRRMSALDVPLGARHELRHPARRQPAARWPDQKKEERFPSPARNLRPLSRRRHHAGARELHELRRHELGTFARNAGSRPRPQARLRYRQSGLTPDFRKPFPYPNQDARESYEKLREYIVHVHIKDGVRDPATGKERYFFPDEGVCAVATIVEDLLASGYDGDFSIEPHMAVVFHDANVSSSERARFDNYLEYGRRFERLLDEVRRRMKK